MRAIRRLNLAAGPRSWLLKQQAAVDGDLTIEVAVRWKARRPTMNGNGVLATLQQMAGYRERCMYCGDSHCCDIEHFRPKADYRASAFVWSNLLWICQPCNRRKSKNLPVDAAGDPMVLDPSMVDPWDYLVYIHETGDVLPRDNLDGVSRAKAENSVSPVYSRINIETVSEGRRRDERTLRRAAVQLCLRGAALEEGAFVEAATDLDHPELIGWFFTREGAGTTPYSDVAARFPEVVRKTFQALNYLHPGM